MPVHGGDRDFTRYTACGLRLLFDRFAEVASGLSCGPAMVLSQLLQYTLLALRGGRRRGWR
jgi:hypothetical protein